MKENKKRQSRFSYKISSELEYVRHFAKVATGECVNNSFELSEIRIVIHTGRCPKVRKKMHIRKQNEKYLQKIIDLSISSDYLVFTRAAFEGAKQNILFNDNNDNMIQQLAPRSTPRGARM